MFITTDGFEVYKTLFTNISLESNLQLKEVKKIALFLYTKNKFNKH